MASVNNLIPEPVRKVPLAQLMQAVAPVPVWYAPPPHREQLDVALPDW